MNTVKIIIQAVFRILNYLFSREYRQKKKKERKEDWNKEMQEDVKNKRGKEVNKDVRDVLKILVISSVFILPSCTTTPVEYIREEDKVISMEYEGRSGWWVPENVFIKLLEKAKDSQED